MKRINSIVSKLIGYFLLLNILTVIIGGSYSYFRFKDALVKRTFNQLTSVRIEKKYRIERFFDERLRDISMVSESEDVMNILGYAGNALVSDDLKKTLINEEYKKFLKKHFNSGNYYTRFYAVSPDSNAVIISMKQSDTVETYFKPVNELPVKNLCQKIALTGNTYLEDYKLDTSANVPAVYIGSPVKYHSGEKYGMVAMEINVDAINSIMYENNPHNGLGESGESYLVGSDFLMRSTSRFQNNSVFRTEVRSEAAVMAFQGITGTSFVKDYRDISVLSSYSKVDIPDLDWAILVEIDEKEAMIPVHSMGLNILYLATLMMLLLFAIVYIIARRISLPIIKLKAAANKITEGNYDVRVENIKSRDELASLVTAFNEMSAKIKEQTGNLQLERNMRLSSMIDGQELERLRLSRELHDGLAQSILAIKMRLERKDDIDPERSVKLMEEVQVLIANVIDEIRRISDDLMPAELDQLGLIETLRNLCREVTENSGIEIVFKSNYHGETLRNEKINTYLYRISQEAINNIIKHSEAENAILEFRRDDKFIYLNISDKGKGFEYNNEMHFCGNGISNIKERVLLLNGEVKIISEINAGTYISIKVPIDNNG